MTYREALIAHSPHATIAERLGTVQSTYLRFPLTISEHAVTVRTPDGLFVATVASVGEARRVVRGYRRAERDQA